MSSVFYKIHLNTLLAVLTCLICSGPAAANSKTANSNEKTVITVDSHKNIQSQFETKNAIYVIKEKIDLKGRALVIPYGCLLDFEGGCFSNGTIEGQHTSLFNAPGYNIFDNSILKGFDFRCFDIRWVGAKSGSHLDAAPYFKRCLENVIQNHNGLSIEIVGEYTLLTGVTTTLDLHLIGYGHPNQQLVGKENNPTATAKHPSVINVGKNVVAFTLVGLGEKTDKGIRATNFSIEGIQLNGDSSNTAVFLRFSAFGAPSRPAYCENIEAHHFDKVFEVVPLNEHNTNTALYNFTIGKGCYFSDNNYSIYSKGSPKNTGGIGGFTVRESVLEQGAKINCQNAFGANVIEKCLLEGQGDPIYFTLNKGSLTVENCYFEGNTGIIKVVGQTGASVDFRNNYVHPDVKQSMALEMENVSIIHIDDDFINANLSLKDARVPLEIYRKLTVDNFKIGSVNYVECILGSEVGSQKANGRVLTYNNKPANRGDKILCVFQKTVGRIRLSVSANDGAVSLYDSSDISTQAGICIVCIIAPQKVNNLRVNAKTIEGHPSLSNTSVCVVGHDESSKYILTDMIKSLANQ